MLAINHAYTCPFFNIAAEEYLLHHKSDNVFRLWTSTPAVITGKHQNAFAEVNPVLLEKNSIPLIRRLSGGGTVYIDKGTINYSFIFNKKDADILDFESMLKPVILYLEEKNIPAVFSGKSNITVNGKKISGNAQHTSKGRILHHGTILVNADVDLLNDVLSSEKRYEDKAVKSIPAKVANIMPGGSIKACRDGFFYFLKQYFTNCSDYCFNAHDINEINQLTKTKYATWQWNYGQSPPSVIEKKINGINFKIQVKNGLVDGINIGGMDGISHVFMHKPYRREVIKKAFYEIRDVLNKYSLDADTVIAHLF